MTKQLTSAEAAALIYGSPGTKVLNKVGTPIWVTADGCLVAGAHTNPSGGALASVCAPFTLPADPDELPEDVLREYRNGTFETMLTALWKHIKPEAKR